MLALQIALAASQAHPDGGDYTLQQWTVADGLASDVVFSVVQADDGFLWVSTSGGVVRFDGHVFDPLDSAMVKGIGQQPVNLAHPLNGAFYLAAGPSEILKVSDTVERFSLPPGRRVQRLSLDQAGGLWVSTTDIAFYRLEHGRLIEVAGGLLDAVDFEPDEQGGRWFASGGGLHHFGSDGTLLESLDLGPMRQVSWDERTQTLAFLAAGFVGFRTPDGMTRSFPFEGLSKGEFLRLRDGRYLFFVRIGEEMYLAAIDPHDSEPAVELLLSLFKGTGVARGLEEDSEGNIWVATDGLGLIKVEARRVRMHAREGPIHRVAALGRGGLVASEACGPVHFYREEEEVDRWTRLPDGTNLGCISALYEDDSGTLWLGTDRGLVKTRDGQSSVLRLGSGWDLADGAALRASALHEGPSGILWVGTTHGLGKAEGDSLVAVRQAVGAALAHISVLKTDRAGSLWIGNDNGLSLFSSGLLRVFTAVDGVPTGAVRAIEILDNGSVLVGWYGQGISVIFPDGQIGSVRSDQGLLNEYISGIVSSGSDVWFHTNYGIQRVSIERVEDVAIGRAHLLTGRIIDSAAGMPEANGGGSSSVVRTRDGSLWFASTRGLAQLPLKYQAGDPLMPRTRIRYLRVNGESRRIDAPVEIDAGEAQVLIGLSGISMSDAERMRYWYRLEGFEQVWHGSQSGEISYPRLPPGDYVLQAKSFLLGMGEPDSEVRLEIKKAAFLHETMWFRALTWLMVVGLIALVSGFYVTRYRTRSQEFERLNMALVTEVAEHQEVREKLLAMARGVHAAQERERRAIARELHDEFGGKLTFLQILLKTGRDREEAMTLVQSIFDGIRSMTRILRPQGLELFGLRSAIQEAVQLFERSTNMAAELALDIGEDERFSTEVENTAFRFVQEALTNVAKHSQGSRVEIRGYSEAGWLTLSVSDDGRGTGGVGVDSGGVGIRGMRERAELVGGEFRLEAPTGGGTRVVLRIPTTETPLAESEPT